MRTWRRFAATAVGLVVIGLLGATLSGQQPERPTSPQVKGVPIEPIASVDGKDNFNAYCAVCHGRTGKGDGPAAPAMKTLVPDLTAITQRHGKFDRLEIEYLIRSPARARLTTPAHGVDHMPIWGDVFGNQNQASTTLRVQNLVRYLESLQVAPDVTKR